MFRSIVLLLTVVLSESVLNMPAAAQTCQDPRKVIGGVDADIKDHPWQVAITLNGEHFSCGGSLIQDRWVLTAAHCFESPAPKRIGVKAGVTKHTSGAWAEVDRVVIHQGYSSTTHENDLALVRLKHALSGDIIPLARPGHELKLCDLLEVTGWGQTAERDRKSTSKVLQKGEVPYIDNATCNAKDAYDGYIKPSMMCAGFRDGGVDSCQGDSGGPLVLRGPDGPVLFGVVSWGEGCARKLKYGVYTRVNAYNDWIANTILANQN